MTERAERSERSDSLLDLFEQLDECEYVRVFREWSGCRVHVLAGDVMIVYRVGASSWAVIDRVYEQELLFDADPLRVFDELAEAWRERVQPERSERPAADHD
jgi:hypothetical protein